MRKILEAEQLQLRKLVHLERQRSKVMQDLINQMQDFTQVSGQDAVLAGVCDCFLTWILNRIRIGIKCCASPHSFPGLLDAGAR